MKKCPFCTSKNLSETLNREEFACDDCGCHFTSKRIFEEGSLDKLKSSILESIKSDFEDPIVILNTKKILDEKYDIIETDILAERIKDFAETLYQEYDSGFRESYYFGKILEAHDKIVRLNKNLVKLHESPWEDTIIEVEDTIMEDDWSQDHVDSVELSYFENEDGTFGVEDHEGNIYPKTFRSEQELHDYFFNHYKVELSDYYDIADADDGSEEFRNQAPEYYNNPLDEDDKNTFEEKNLLGEYETYRDEYGVLWNDEGYSDHGHVNWGRDRMPSQKQISFAKRLGINAENYESSYDLSRAIDKKMTERNKPTEKQISFAKRLGVENPESMTKKELSSAISAAKGVNENDEDEDIIDLSSIEDPDERAETLRNLADLEDEKSEILGEDDSEGGYENVVSMQGDDAEEALDILDEHGEEAAIEHLKQWHYPGEHEVVSEIGSGIQDTVYETEDGYILTYNNRDGYIGLYANNTLGEAISDRDNPTADNHIEQIIQYINDNPDKFPEIDTNDQEAIEYYAYELLRKVNDGKQSPYEIGLTGPEWDYNPEIDGEVRPKRFGVDDLEEGIMSELDIVAQDVVEWLKDNDIDSFEIGDETIVKNAIKNVAPEYCDDEDICQMIISSVKEKMENPEDDFEESIFEAKKPTFKKVKSTKPQDKDKKLEKVWKYMQTKKSEKSDGKSRSEAASLGEEEDEIPYTQKEMKDEDNKLKECNGFKLGDSVRCHNTIATINKFKNVNGNILATLVSEGKRFDVDPYSDIEFTENDCTHERIMESLSSQKKVWEKLSESLDDTLISTPSSLGVGGLIDTEPVMDFQETERADKNTIYSFIKDNDLHRTNREHSLSSISGEFLKNDIEELAQIYDDAVLSDSEEHAENIDAQYGYETEILDGWQTNDKLSQAWTDLDSQGI